jgi:hypothetical protein
MKVPAMMGIHMMKSFGLVKLSPTPMMQGVVSEPRLSVPVVITTPIPPVATELTVVYVMISWWQSEDIVRWDNPDRCRDEAWLDESPGSIVDAGPKPVTLMETEPDAIEEIETYRVRD